MPLAKVSASTRYSPGGRAPTVAVAGTCRATPFPSTRTTAGTPPGTPRMLTAMAPLAREYTTDELAVCPATMVNGCDADAGPYSAAEVVTSTERTWYSPGASSDSVVVPV